MTDVKKVSFQAQCWTYKRGLLNPYWVRHLSSSLILGKKKPPFGKTSKGRKSAQKEVKIVCTSQLVLLWTPKIGGEPCEAHDGVQNWQAGFWNTFFLFSSILGLFFFLDRDRVITIQELTQKQNRTTTTKGLQSPSHWYTRVIYSVWLHLAQVGQKSMMFW